MQAATVQIRNKNTNLPLLKNGYSPAEGIKQLRDLANNLPTQPDLPSTDSRDTALRSIIAILRTHSFPGTENLTHQAKEDPNAKAQSVGETGTHKADQAVPGEVAGSDAAF